MQRRDSNSPRLIYAPINEPGSEQLGLEKAFRKKFTTSLFDYRLLGRSGNNAAQIGVKLINMAKDFKPDYIHIQVQDSQQIPAEALQQVRRFLPNVKITQWNGDVRTSVSKYQKEISRACDMTLLSAGGKIPEYKRAGAGRVEYWQVGIDPDLEIPKKDDIEEWAKRHGPYKIVFLANNYGTRFPSSQDRVRLVTEFRRVFKDDFAVFGNSWPPGISKGLIPYRKQGVASATALVTLGMNHFRGLSRYYSDRTAIAIASGACHLTDYIPGIDNEYLAGKEIVTFKTIDEALAKASELLKFPAHAMQIGRSGQLRALKDHTWDRRVDQYVKYLETL